MNKLILAALVLAAPASAQQVAGPGVTKPKVASGPGEVSRNAPVNGVLTLFGNQRCPTDSSGNEVVVCVRRGANEQFRVPKELRDLQVTEANKSWALKAKSSLTTGDGVASIGSCSVAGVGGASGCLAQELRVNRAINQQRKAEQPDLP